MRFQSLDALFDLLQKLTRLSRVTQRTERLRRPNQARVIQLGRRVLGRCQRRVGGGRCGSGSGRLYTHARNIRSQTHTVSTSLRGMASTLALAYAV